MIESKSWDWNAQNDGIWHEPCEESYFYAERWKREGRKTVLDLGCGLGRHSLLFARYGFEVSACDLSDVAVEQTKSAAEKLGYEINTTQCDMLDLPYGDDSFDAIFSFLVISHTDTEGFKKVLSEIRRVLRPGGAVFLTLCAKDTWSFAEANFPKIDENTVVKDNEGPEKNVPHFYVDLQDVLGYFGEDYDISTIRHIDNCYAHERIQNNRHYFIYAMLK